jgi:hypothetical protein
VKFATVKIGPWCKHEIADLVSADTHRLGPRIDRPRDDRRTHRDADDSGRSLCHRPSDLSRPGEGRRLDAGRKALPPRLVPGLRLDVVQRRDLTCRVVGERRYLAAVGVTGGDTCPVVSSLIAAES